MTALKPALAGRFVRQQPYASVLAVIPDFLDGLCFSSTLDGFGCRVKCVASGYDALRCLWREAVDVVLCDCELPDGTWQELLEEVLVAFKPAPAFLLACPHGSAHSVPDGVHNVLSKPLEARQLLYAISDAARVTRDKRHGPPSSRPFSAGQPSA